MFKKLDGDTAMIRKGGGYRPCDLYEWLGGLYVKMGSEYIRLRANGTTSKDGVTLEHLEYDGPLYADKFSRLAVVHREGYTSLESIPGETLKLEPPKGNSDNG